MARAVAYSEECVRFGLADLRAEHAPQHVTDEAGSVPLEPAVIHERATPKYRGEPHRC